MSRPQLTSFAQELFASLYEELCSIDQGIEAMQVRISRVFASQEACPKIAEVEGVGPFDRNAIVGATRLWPGFPQWSAVCGLAGTLFRANIPAEIGNSYLEPRNRVIHIYECC
jgi:hypothetical protein